MFVYSIRGAAYYVSTISVPLRIASQILRWKTVIMQTKAFVLGSQNFANEQFAQQKMFFETHESIDAAYLRVHSYFFCDVRFYGHESLFHSWWT